MSIIAPIPRPERRLMQKAIHKTRESLSIILCNCHRIKGDRSGGHRTR